MIWYLIIINMVGFILYTLNVRLSKNPNNPVMKWIISILSVAGGSFGVLLSIVLFDRKSTKENMLTRVVAACMFVIQLILGLLLAIKGDGHLSFDIWNFIIPRKPLWIYLIAANLVAFLVYGLDKLLAVREKRRVPIVTLLLLAFIGGSIGSWAAMYIFRHKTKKDYFYIGVPLMLLMQLTVLFCLNNIV